MEFGLSQEQGLLQDSIARFVKDQVSLETVRAVAADGANALNGGQ